MNNVNLPTLIVTLVILGVAGYFRATGKAEPALVTALVGVLTNSFLPQVLSKAKVTVTARIGSDPPKAP